MVIVLDTFPTSCVSKRPGSGVPGVSDRCREWINECEIAGHQIMIPAISYFEALRELEQRQATNQILRLKRFCLQPHRFISLTTAHLELAAKLWGQSRRTGRPTADPHALDGDVIIAAQVISLGLSASELLVATTNPAHLSRYVPSNLWTNIKP